MSNDLKYDAIRCVIRLCDDSTFELHITFDLVCRYTTLATTFARLKVPGSIPGCGINFSFFFLFHISHNYLFLLVYCRSKEN